MTLRDIIDILKAVGITVAFWIVICYCLLF